MTIAQTSGTEQLRAHLAAGGVGVLAIMLFGSWSLMAYDPAPTAYGLALVVSGHAAAHRIAMWIQRPSTLVLFQRALSILIQPKLWRPARQVATDGVNVLCAQHVRVQAFAIRWGRIGRL